MTDIVTMNTATAIAKADTLRALEEMLRLAEAPRCAEHNADWTSALKVAISAVQAIQ